MLLNYIRLSCRLLVRNPFFTGINVIGLAIGFTTFFALFDFATRELIELGVDVFVIAALIAIGIALLTVTGQSLKVARANPVDSLRYE